MIGLDQQSELLHKEPFRVAFRLRLDFIPQQP